MTRLVKLQQIYYSENCTKLAMQSCPFKPQTTPAPVIYQSDRQTLTTWQALPALKVNRDRIFR